MAKSTKKSKNQTEPVIKEGSVLHDEMLDIDVQSEDVEVLADDVQLDNEAVSVAAVIKNTHHEDDKDDDKTKNQQEATKNHKHKKETTHDDSKTKVFDERVEQVLGDDKKSGDDKKVNDKKVNDKNTDNKKQTDNQDDSYTAVDQAIDKAETAVDKAKAAVGELAHDVKTAAHALTQDGAQALSQTALAQKAADIKDDIKTTVDTQASSEQTSEQIKADVKDSMDAIKQEISSKTEELSEQAFALKENISHRAEDVAHDIKDKLDETKSKLDDVKLKFDDSKDKLAQKVDELTGDLTDKKDELMDEVSARNEQAIKDAKAYEKTHKKGTIATRLGMMGAYFGSLYHAKADYVPANLDDDSQSDIFHRQGSKLVENVFGPKAVSAHSLAKKVVPQSKMDAISELAYDKVANWAQKWATIELNSDERFGQLSLMSESQKSAFADDIANQNRALATLGGLTGFMGLKGVVIDTAWLLLISLKSIYQLAMIYDKPLTGKAGIKTAYSILSACDLDKLQDKQLIMTALALGNVVLANAQSTSVADELKKLGEKYQNRSYTKGFEELSKFVDLDRLNPSWLHWLLPTTSTAISAHYNNELIAEVLGVAKATFAPTTVKLLEDKR